MDDNTQPTTDDQTATDQTASPVKPIEEPAIDETVPSESPSASPSVAPNASPSEEAEEEESFEDPDTAGSDTPSA